jgi:tRNA dimethylallyltransferase
MGQKKIILIAGPTSSGKSKLATKLANYLKGEIINADSMQIYKEISILTSKPSTKDKKNVPHHLYGFNSVKKKFSTGHWLELAIKKIEEQWKMGLTPVVVGGTGLYFKALTDGLVKIPNIPDNLKKQVTSLHQKLGQQEFYKKLIKLDPLAKNFVLPSDVHRSLRVYEVKSFTNNSLFELIKNTKSNYTNSIFKKIFIDIPKEELHQKIEQRVEKMFADGAIEEAKSFFKMKIYRELSANKIIGIREIKDYLQKRITLSEAKKLISQRTKQYAKRQFTWSRGHMKSWNKLYSPNINDLLKKSINIIS